MVQVQGVSKLNLALINQEAKTGPTLSQQMEKAPKLGFGNAFLIGLKAFGKSVMSEKTFSAIRSELKREVINTKIEHRMEKLAQKFGETNEQKIAVKAELREQMLIRKMGLDTSQSHLSQSVDSTELRLFGMKTSKSLSDINIVMPNPNVEKDPTGLKAHYSNFIDRVQKELDTKNLQKEERLPHFKKLFTDFVATNLSLTEVVKFDRSQLGNVVQQFRDEHRTEKQQFMQVIKDVFSSLDDPKSDLVKKFDQLGAVGLKGALSRLPEEGPTNFLRDKNADQFNMSLYLNGADKLTTATKDFVRNAPLTEKFQELTLLVGSISLNGGASASFKNATMTPDIMNVLGDLANDLIKELRQDKNSGGLKDILSDIKNIFINEAASGKVSEAVAQRGNKLFGESSILLRFVTPHVSAEKIGGGQDTQRAQMVLGQFLQAVANGPEAPDTFDEPTTTAFNQQAASLKDKLNEFLNSLGVPTSTELTQAITNKRLEIAAGQLDSVVENLDGLLKGLPKAKSDGESTGDNAVQNTDGVKNPPQVDVASLTKIKIFGKSITDNAPQKTDEPKSPPKPEVKNLPKTENSEDEYVIEENLGDLRGINDDDDDSDDEIDEDHLTLQYRADRKSLLSEEYTLDELNDLLDNTPQTPMSEEDRKRLQDLDDEFNEVMKSDK